MKRNIRT